MVGEAHVEATKKGAEMARRNDIALGRGSPDGWVWTSSICRACVSAAWAAIRRKGKEMQSRSPSETSAPATIDPRVTKSAASTSRS